MPESFYPPTTAYEMARATNSAAMNVGTSFFTNITWDTNDANYPGTAALHSTSTNTSRFTASVAGRWRFTATLGWTGNTTGSRTLRVQKNGTEVTRATWPGFGYSPDGKQVVWEGYLALNDYLELSAYNDSGGTLDSNNNTSSWAVFERIG